MSSKTIHTLTLATFAAATTLAGCAVTNPPLVFGDTTTLGLRLGNDTSSAGGSVSFGYKASSVAMVPVSILNQEGQVELLASRNVNGTGSSSRSDAMSVFASFTDSSSSKSKDGKPAVAFGQVFSTGLAAQTITRSFCETAGGGCQEKNALSLMASEQVASTRSAPRANGNAARQNRAAAADGPYQSPLLFMRTDVIGIDIGGTLAQHGLQFVLGYGNKNLALIPVAALDVDRQPVKIAGTSDGTGNDLLDTLSVVGQFHARTDTESLDLGLERYFATGIAARNLSDGISQVAAQKLASTKQAAPSPEASEKAKDSTLARN